jgi:hypothetical protein
MFASTAFHNRYPVSECPDRGCSDSSPDNRVKDGRRPPPKAQALKVLTWKVHQGKYQPNDFTVYTDFLGIRLAISWTYCEPKSTGTIPFHYPAFHLGFFIHMFPARIKKSFLLIEKPGSD